jgi:hypothetical protein
MRDILHLTLRNKRDIQFHCCLFRGVVVSLLRFQDITVKIFDYIQLSLNKQSYNAHLKKILHSM